MLTETATVLAVDHDGLWVETYKQSACAQCSAKKGCGQSLLAQAATTNMTCIKAYFNGPTSRVWAVGDSVEIGVTEIALLKAAFISYLVPLLCLILGAILGNQMGRHDVFSVLGAGLGLVIGFALAKWHSTQTANLSLYNAVIIE